MNYYLLDEPFSAYTGLALSSFVANMMRFDERSVVVCSEADDTWGYTPERILVKPQLRLLTAVIRGSKMSGWRYIPLIDTKTDYLFYFWLFPVPTKEWGYRLVPELAVRCRGAGPSSSHERREANLSRSELACALCGRRLFKSMTPDALVFNSEAMRKEALELMPHLKNTCTIHNGADEAIFYPQPPRAAKNHTVPIILYVGRLVPQKGVHVLMEAMKILQNRYVPVLCKVVGSSHSGGRKSKTTTYVKSLHKLCPSNVRFEGFRAATDLGQEYRAANVFCCPSIWKEPFGNTNIEAMACGIPVVATRVGGVPEIAAEGGVFLVEPNSATDLADALQMLILDKDLRAKMAAEGLASFRRRFTWATIVKQHRKLVDRLQETQLSLVLPDLGHNRTRRA